LFKGVIFSIISATCYATLPIFGKIGYQLEMDTFLMLQCRFLFAGLILGIYYAITSPKTLIATPKIILKCLILGLVFYLPQSMFFISALKYIPASTDSLILYIYPLTVLFISVVFLKERMTKSKLISVVIIIIGCCLIFYDVFLREQNMKGIMIALGAMVFFSNYLIFSQVFMKGGDPKQLTLYVALSAALGFSIINGTDEIMSLTQNQLIFSISFGLVPTALAISLLYIAIEKIGAAYASIFSSIEPAITLFLAWTVLNEDIQLIQIFGMLAIIIGIALPNLKMLKRQPSSS
jgi:drug/metabolite transporter (DMT)-like permease